MEPSGSLKTWTQVIYALHAVSLLTGILIAWLPMAVVGVWFIYRIVRGWVALSGGRPMYG